MKDDVQLKDKSKVLNKSVVGIDVGDHGLMLENLQNLNIIL